MCASPTLQPDPSAIGGVPKVVFAMVPDPARMFSARADRFATLAAGSPLAPWLLFLEALTRAQAALAAELPPLPAPDPAQAARARAGGMPPLDRAALADDPALAATVEAFLDAAAPIPMPAQAELALAEVRRAAPEVRAEMLRSVLADDIPPEGAAHHLFLAAGAQVHMARAAAALDGAALVPVATGACPACGGKPAVSLVVGFQGAEGARYAVCACCATRWNEVRVKCLCCGSTKGIGYRSVDEGQAPEDATIKAEVCDTCHRWVKILYQNRNAALDPIADDVGSLGLDLMMRDSDWSRGGFDPLLVGY